MNAAHDPGTIIDLAGTALYRVDLGSGGPSVVLEAGAGGFSATWSLVQAEVARFARVISYDRAGYARSAEAPPHPARTAAQAADELHELLCAAQVPPPYVLVGHSFGGFIVRLFASRYPDEVAGMVLVDADHEDEWTDAYPEEHRTGLRLATRMMGVLAALARVGIPQLLVRLKLPEPLARLPAEARATVRTHGFRPKTLRTIHREFLGLAETAREVRTQAGSLDDLPLVVLRRGRPGPTAPGVSRQMAERLEQLAEESQEKLAALSTRGVLLVAEASGHEIPIEQPQRVVEAIRRVVEEIRSNGVPGA